ncbi:MAG TPA: hypothetical protein VFE96_06790, partial [Candidatus Bathyarchaeia archaeon]|nr:hypothetical protein [Candidatus Bathyarchaeia archaeon]
MVSLPIGHAGSSITFKTKTSIATVTGTTASGSISAATGDTIIVNIYGVGAFNSFAVSDGTNSYSQRVASITANGALFSTYIWAATVSVAASLTVTITTGGATRTYAATLLDYSGVSGFGVTATDQNDAPSCISNSCTSTVTLTNTAGVGSAIVENFDDVWNFATQTNTYNNGQTQRDTFLCLQGSFEPCFSYDSLAPGTTFSLSTTFSQGPGSGSPSGWSHSALELLGTTTNPSTTITQCFGNCGSPAITLANTNSTHTTNFNQSITLLYEFQSSLNGYLLNVTTNVAKSYKAIPNGPSFGVYLVTSCPIGQSPFTPQCPGVLSTQSGAQNFFSPAKGRASFSGLLIPVSNGQWIGIAMTAFFSGFDVNDT